MKILVFSDSHGDVLMLFYSAAMDAVILMPLCRDIMTRLFIPSAEITTGIAANQTFSLLSLPGKKYS